MNALIRQIWANPFATSSIGFMSGHMFGHTIASRDKERLMMKIVWLEKALDLKTQRLEETII